MLIDGIGLAGDARVIIEVGRIVASALPQSCQFQIFHQREVSAPCEIITLIASSIQMMNVYRSMTERKELDTLRSTDRRTGSNSNVKDAGYHQRRFSCDPSEMG